MDGGLPVTRALDSGSAQVRGLPSLDAGFRHPCRNGGALAAWPSFMRLPCRLSGYWHPFREKSGVCCPLLKPLNRKKFKTGDTDYLILDTFKPGASFQNAVDLHVFDKKLRLTASL
jgi:hypothetical protein